LVTLWLNGLLGGWAQWLTPKLFLLLFLGFDSGVYGVIRFWSTNDGVGSNPIANTTSSLDLEPDGIKREVGRMLFWSLNAKGSWSNKFFFFLLIGWLSFSQIILS
jgi:hypothetical protein